MASFGVASLWICRAAPVAQNRVGFPRAAAQSDDFNLNPYPGKPRLTFNEDGTFKITVFSDLHYGENPWDVWGPQQDVNSTTLMNTVLTSEKPDYVVLNGDLITGENTFRENSTKLIDEIVAPLNKLKLPFSSTHGNHDNEPNITHAEEIKRELQVAPLSYTRFAPSWANGQGYGPGTYWVPVYTKATDHSPSLVLWFFDSRGGFSEGVNSTRVPDWVDENVATWINFTVATMDAAWGPAEKVNRGSLAFVHIPPHVVQDLQPNLNSTQDPGLNADELGSGSTQATTLPQDADKDDPFWNALNAQVKNLHGVISGHDHGNEWCKREITKNVIFCFDKHSGYGGYSSTGWGHGVRNIVFRSPDPNVGPETWIRMEDGETHARIIMDSSYN
ncbi:Metallo-dependent phosphatase [Dichomitus squalens LYAD-421 SS1]|uniref:Metallo-dependent phosphatase n=1 Tax=Dichomitus squalens (strain LYAD-421) TaxID=732165 RepID=R7SMK9_DICSQ|nr:Metallo-dependent phosphatase [Dichomitus squalens LYAD-421 SS1]EJF56970.1 Metallo-dependent phosphatase [Dichomitus squalens LYAD-421 SS1]